MDIVRAQSGDQFDAVIQRGGGIKSGAKAGGRYMVECWTKDGKLRWRDYIDNRVVNVGLDHILSAVIAAGTQITSWFVGLTSSAPTTAQADTMASHPGWTERTEYTQGTRPAYTPGAVSGQSVDNSASRASFSINANVTIGGAFLVSNSTKGGTTGTLYSVGAFSGGDKVVQNGDTLLVQATFTQADDGV